MISQSGGGFEVMGTEQQKAKIPSVGYRQVSNPYLHNSVCRRVAAQMKKSFCQCLMNDTQDPNFTRGQCSECVFRAF